jgi:hypothetical protein
MATDALDPKKVEEATDKAIGYLSGVESPPWSTWEISWVFTVRSVGPGLRQAQS